MLHDALRTRCSKSLPDMYKATVSTKQNVQKTIIAGRAVEMVNIFKDELSTMPLTLANHGCEKNSTPKAELISILMAEADMKTCVLIDGHGLIRALGKPHSCRRLRCVPAKYDTSLWSAYNKTRCGMSSLHWGGLKQGRPRRSRFASSSKDNMSHFHMF